MQSFTMTDTMGTLAATVLLGLFLLPPGFLLGYASNVLAFRQRSASERLLISLALSMAVVPVISVLLVRVAGMTVALALFLLAAIAACVMLARQYKAQPSGCSLPQRSTWFALAMMLAWVCLALFCLVDWDTLGRLYISYSAYDHSIRVMMVDAALRTGVPPRNPLFDLGTAPTLRYYYYWYVICALPVRLGGLTPRAGLNGSVVWSGFAVAALVPLYLKHYMGVVERLRFMSLVGIALLMVTGYDLLPYLYLTHRLRAIWGDTEWWDTNQVASWIGSFVWVPHHIAGLVACLVGFLLLSMLSTQSSPRERIWSISLAGAAFASAAGLSVYVTFTFAIFILIWTLIVLLREPTQMFVNYASAGIVSLLLSLPFLSDLRAPSKAGSRFASFAFRDYEVAQQWLKLQGVHDPAILAFSRYPSTVVVYFFEFGLYFLVGWLCFRQAMRQKWQLTTRQLAAWTMLGVCLLVVTFLSSDATGANDLGFRGILVVQFVLLIWAAPWVSGIFYPSDANRLSAGWRIALALSVLLGVCGTLLQVGILRAYAPMIDAGISRRTEPWMGPLPGLGQHTRLMREGIEELKRVTPRTAVLQYNPIGSDVFLFHLYANRQVSVGDESCGTTFGGSWEECKQVLPYLNAFFNRPNEEAAKWSLDEICDDIHVDVIAVTSSDKAWYETQSWVWTRKPLVANDALRAFRCGTHPIPR